MIFSVYRIKKFGIGTLNQYNKLFIRSIYILIDVFIFQIKTVNKCIAWFKLILFLTLTFSTSGLLSSALDCSPTMIFLMFLLFYQFCALFLRFLLQFPIATIKILKFSESEKFLLGWQHSFGSKSIDMI